MNDHFYKRLKKLLRADLKPRFIVVVEDGSIASGVADKTWAQIEITQDALFFTDIELPTKKAILFRNIDEREFGLVLRKMAPELKSFARVASFPSAPNQYTDWAIQFENDRDLQTGLKHFMQRAQEYAICIAYAPNQEAKP